MKYKGTVEWFTGEPPKSGRYLVTISDHFVDTMVFTKGSVNEKWTSNSDSEDGGRIKYNHVKAWAYIPEPYCGE